MAHRIPYTKNTEDMGRLEETLILYEEPAYPPEPSYRSKRKAEAPKVSNTKKPGK